MRAVVGRVGPLRDRPVGSGVGPWVAEERYRKPIGAYEPGPNHTHGSSVARRSRATLPTVVRGRRISVTVMPLMHINK